jgi:Uma2 family endonuclease
METKTSSPVRLTYELLLRLPADGKRHELIDGEHYVTPAPTTRHQRSLGNLYMMLRRFCDERQLGEVFFAPVDVVLSELDVVEPDLLFIARSRSAIVQEACVTEAPDLVVEVLSPSTRRTDALVKRKLYERFGVREYWIVDPEIARIEVYRKSADGLHRVLEPSLEGQPTFVSPLFPGLELALETIFR